MTERERLLEKLGKVKALADRGEGGEKESAERTLAALMKRYGITGGPGGQKGNHSLDPLQDGLGAQTAGAAGLYAPGHGPLFRMRGKIHKEAAQGSGD